MLKVGSKFLSIVVPVVSLLCLPSPTVCREKVKDKSRAAIEMPSDDEAFLARRIAEFWKDGDYDTVKSQINDFVSKYPHSSSGNLMRGILGDLYLQEKRYKVALESYSAITNPEVKEKVLLNKLQCYYELGRYGDLVSEALPCVSTQPSCFAQRMDEFNFLVGEGFFHQAAETSDSALKEEMLELAEPHYEKLLSTPYADTSLFAIAEINRQLGRPKKASQVYLELATRYPGDEEELLFQAATMQALFDKNLSLESFEKLSHSPGNRAVESRFNQMILYFQQEEYAKVLQLEETLFEEVPSSQKGLFHYVVGKSHFSVNDFESASRHIKNYLEYEPSEGSLDKNALLILMTCAAEMDSEQMFDQTLSQFTSLFPNDEELPKALFMHAMICKKQGNHSKQGERLEYLLANYPKFEDMEGLLFEYGVFSHDQQRWNDCYLSFTRYLEKFPSGSRHIGARKFFISACLHLLKASQESSESQYSAEALTADLEKALDAKNSFTEKEQAQYKLLYAKTLYTTGDFVKALRVVSSLGTDFSDVTFLSEIYYLLAESSHQLGRPPEEFYQPMEKALELNPDLGESDAVQLQLYNSYIVHSKILSDLRDADEMTQEKKEELLEKAATHLYNAFRYHSSNLKLENQLWLANHFYQKAADKEIFQPTGENFLTALHLYEKILLKNAQKELVPITPDSLFLEQEALKYSQLLGYQKAPEEKVRVLKHLAEAQTLHPDWDWRLRNEVLLELAKSYEVLSDMDSALETYSFLQMANDLGYASLATFHASKIKFHLLDKEEAVEQSAIVKAILNDLKELQIRKNPLSEPLHLEAGLEYATIRSKIASEKKQEERYIFFLKRLIEDFESPTDPIAVDYKNKLFAAPEKKALYSLYMRFIEAELLRTEAKIQQSKKDPLQAEELSSEALAILSELQSSAQMDPYLQKRLQDSIEAITAVEIFD